MFQACFYLFENEIRESEAIEFMWMSINNGFRKLN